MIKNKHNGFSALHILLLLSVFSFVAASGYFVYSRDNKDNNSVSENPVTNNVENNNSNPAASEQETLLSNYENENYRFSYPANWLIGDQSEIRCLFSPDASMQPRNTSCEIQKPEGFTSISIRYSSVGYAVKLITDVAVYNGVSFTKNSTTNSGYTVYEFNIKPEEKNGNIAGKLVRIAYPDNPDAWVELDYKYLDAPVDYSSVFEGIISSLELLSSENIGDIGG